MGKTVGILALGLLSTASWAAGTHVPVGGAMPLYFSGTSCVASGIVYSTSYDEEIVEAWLYVGGWLVRHQVAPPGEPRGGIALSVVFDSSNFADGAVLEVRIVGMNDDNQFFIGTGYAPVNNRIAGFNYDGFYMPGTVGTNELVSQMSGRNYSFYIQTQGWGKVLIGAGLASAGVYYVNSHGCKIFHHTCFDEAEQDKDAYMYADRQADPGQPPPRDQNYEYLRETLNGNGLPPYNSSAVPPVHFAFMDFCESGGAWGDPPPGTNYFSSLLLPWMDENWPNLWCPNQAVWTWKAYTRPIDAEDGVWWAFSKLQQRKTVMTARDEFVIENRTALDRVVHISPTVSPWSWIRVTEVWQVPVWGDHTTRIKGVWTGTHMLPPSIWYR